MKVKEKEEWMVAVMVIRGMRKRMTRMTSLSRRRMRRSSGSVEVPVVEPELMISRLAGFVSNAAGQDLGLGGGFQEEMAIVDDEELPEASKRLKKVRSFPHDHRDVDDGVVANDRPAVRTRRLTRSSVY